METEQALPYKDCLSCRIIGTGTLTGVGGYALMQSKATAPGTPVQKRIMAGLGVGMNLCRTTIVQYATFLPSDIVFIIAGITRWFKNPLEPSRKH
ncbi:hypothetical protein EDD18DRAFT_302643 [Armillaria luteobubalina]|uniref:Distal membrane-arm assembly complex protein 1-like domain-containing protein n=1 Tax=Armillaria luteobubalina TaxID=153913 RepID=A0AA39QMF3_9AGAR|nr:hypothetical protein EDD18DRAFT_302643 [Armillaria luteobubalina]